MRPRVVFDLVLNELKSGQTDAVKRLMVGAAGIRDRNRAGPHIAERQQPLLE